MEITRSKLLTAQEHELIDSTTDEKYKNDHYRPQAVVDGSISVEECQKLRQNRERGELWNVKVRYWRIEGFYGVAKLENLDIEPTSKDYGKTISDPTLIQIFQERKMFLIDMNFPFKRHEPIHQIK